MGTPPSKDDFGKVIDSEFIDGKTKMGLWAFMTPKSFEEHSPRLGLGIMLGQRYQKQSDGRWLKVEG